MMETKGITPYTITTTTTSSEWVAPSDAKIDTWHRKSDIEIITEPNPTVANPVVLSDTIMRELVEHIQELERDISLSIALNERLRERVEALEKEIPF